MNSTFEVHAYLAGPDVFFPNALESGREKKEKLAKVGIIGHFPFDNEIPPDVAHDPRKASMAIASANERMMLECCTEDRIGIILANMNPFYGPSMDVGTGFEVGFMSALATTKRNVIIIGYTEDPLKFEERVIKHIYGGWNNVTEKDGRIYGIDGSMIEAFGRADNLMVTNAIEKTGGAVVRTFSEAVFLAKKLANRRALGLTMASAFKNKPEKPGRPCDL